MPKQLSALQQVILRVAYEYRIKHPRTATDISIRKVLINFYKFKPVIDMDEAQVGALVFDRQIIGIKRYNAASVAIVKSFNRLVARGLATSKYIASIKLTKAGVKVAKELAKSS